jgi:hypothetical protein
MPAQKSRHSRSCDAKSVLRDSRLPSLFHTSVQKISLRTAMRWRRFVQESRALKARSKTLKCAPPNGWQQAARTIAFVAADDEYRSEITMPFLAKLVEGATGMRASLHFATGDDGVGGSAKTPDITARTGLTDDWQLRGADASVLYMRFRELGHNQMLAFEAATTHGLGPVQHRVPGVELQALPPLARLEAGTLFVFGDVVEHGDAVAALPPHGDVRVVVAGAGVDLGQRLGMILQPDAGFFAEQFEIGEFSSHDPNAMGIRPRPTSQAGQSGR